MRETTEMKQRWRNRWRRSAGAVLSLAVLSAVAVAGINQFGPKVLAMWKTVGSGEQALSSGGAFEGLLNFEAPSATVAQQKTDSETAGKGIKKAEASMLAKNWQFTATSPQLASLLANNIALDFFLYMNNNSNGIQEFLEANTPLNFIAASGALTVFGLFLESLLPRVMSNPALTSLITGYVNFLRGLQASINTFIPPAFRPPPIPPISPSI